MSELQHVQRIFERLRLGYHLSPEDEPEFSALSSNFAAYADYFAQIGLKLIRHPREFFYFEAEASENISDTLPRIAAFSFILVDHVANQGHSIEEHLLGRQFLLSQLPHFTLDRYKDILRQVGVEDDNDLRLVIKNLARVGWVKMLGHDEFKFLRPIHRIFDKCIDLSRERLATEADASNDDASSE